MADPVLELDAAASNIDGTNPGTAMLLVDATTGWGLTAFDAPQPELKLLWTSSIDTDGARRADPGNYENRTITATLSCERSTAALLQAQLRILGTKIGKINREGGPTGVGGTLKVTYPSGNTFIFDLLTASHNFTFDDAFVLGNLAQVTVSFTALPGARGAEQDLGDNTETTLPALIFTEASIPGDLPALGRLVVDDDSAVSQWWLTWGIQSRYYSSSANAALFYEAEGRTVLGGSVTSSSRPGASGAGPTQILNTDLAGTYKAILSTQASGGGAHLSHVGTFRVYARIYSEPGVTVAWEWGEGDYLNATINTPVEIPERDIWLLVDLGLVTLRPVLTGTQRWEGRLIAKEANSGTEIAVDYLLFVPVAEGWGTANGLARFQTATAFSAEDRFDQAAGALAGKTLPTGGTWAGAGDADDFAVETTGKTAQRTAISDAATGVETGRFALAGTNTYSAIAVQADMKWASAISGGPGVFARYTDTNNFLVARINTNAPPTNTTLVVHKRVAGSTSTFPVEILGTLAAGTYYTLRLLVDAGGRVWCWVFPTGSAPGAPKMALQHADLATGGALASGRVGLYEWNTSTVATARNYDNFVAFVPVADAAIFASQSLEIRHDRITREDSGGTLWPRVSSYEGDYLLVPPSGAEARTTRVVVKATRNDPVENDSAIDDISARLFVTPRYLAVPSA